MIQGSLRGALPCRAGTALLQRSDMPIGRAVPLGTRQALGRAGVERRLQGVEGGARIVQTALQTAGRVLDLALDALQLGQI